MNLNKNSWETQIDKLMLWRGSWTKYDSKLINFLLRVHYDQLLILSENRILETFNMHNKIKGIYKEDVLILIVNNSSKEIRKIKFQIKSNAAQILQMLGQHFTVISHNSTQSCAVSAKYRNINEVLKYAMDNKDITQTSNLPTAAFANFMKICLLDPTFPNLVFEAEKVVNSEL